MSVPIGVVLLREFGCQFFVIEMSTVVLNLVSFSLFTFL